MGAVGTTEKPQIAKFIDLLDVHRTDMRRDLAEAAGKHACRRVVDELLQFFDCVVAH